MDDGNDSQIFKIFFDRELLEKSKFPQINSLDNLREIHITFTDSCYMNSQGFVRWLQWLKPMGAVVGLQIHLYQCSSMVIQLVNMFSANLPKNLVVKSCWVPFFSEQTGELRQVLCLASELKQNGQLVLPKVYDSKGAEMNLNIIEDQYFKFLK